MILRSALAFAALLAATGAYAQTTPSINTAPRVSPIRMQLYMRIPVGSRAEAVQLSNQHVDDAAKTTGKKRKRIGTTP